MNQKVYLKSSYAWMCCAVNVYVVQVDHRMTEADFRMSEAEFRTQFEARQSGTYSSSITDSKLGMRQMGMSNVHSQGQMMWNRDMEFSGPPLHMPNMQRNRLPQNMAPHLMDSWNRFSPYDHCNNLSDMQMMIEAQHWRDPTMPRPSLQQCIMAHSQHEQEEMHLRMMSQAASGQGQDQGTHASQYQQHLNINFNNANQAHLEQNPYVGLSQGSVNARAMYNAQYQHKP